jgi:uncharacterized membrane protein HdeD (DUF308 family)
MSQERSGGYPQSESSLSMLSRSWGLVLTTSVVAIVVGALMLGNPDKTLKVVAVLVGIWFLVLGIVSAIRTFATKHIDAGQRLLLALLAILGIVAGVVALKNPGLTIAVLAILLGAVWLVQGIVEFFGSLGDPGTPARGWRIFGGLITAIAGVVVLVWPAPSAAVLAWITGLWLVVYGIVGVFAAFKIRKLGEEVVPGPGGPSIRL